MTVGETLARARRDAGLSVAEISIRTRIRQSVIDGIERDDYSACGGHSGARGDIAAIARALGVDSRPLVRAYDAARPRPAEWIVASKSSEPVTTELAPEARAAGREPGPVTTEPEPEPVTPEPVTPGPEPEPVSGGEDTQPLTIGHPPEPVTAREPPGPITIGELLHPTTLGQASGPVRLTFADRHRVTWIALGAALVAIAALGGILLIVGTGGQAARHAVVAGGHRNGGGSAPRPSRTQPLSPAHSPSSLGRTPPASPPSSRPMRLLAPASVAAFGPGGTGDGDSPQLARQALAGNPAAPWHSAWYTTPNFGNLQSGTGLLVDMGRTVTITAARIALGSERGADLALRIGNAPTMPSMRPVARANGVGGVVRLTTAPTRGRFVLVWFTRLPPDQAGTFQVLVYDIKLRGHP